MAVNWGDVILVRQYLDLNYPCECNQVDCPGNFEEAVELVSLLADEELS